MHELSIAMAVVEQVEAAARTEGVARVTGVRLRVGELAGVVPDALRFSFGLACAGTVLDGAELTVDAVAAMGRCGGCGGEVPVGMPPDLSCPRCGAPVAELLSGRELEIAAVLVEGPEDEEASDVPHR